MTIDEFTRLYPALAFDFARPLGEQPRLYAGETLAELPEELTATYTYRSGGRGRPNLNQTRTHAQCTTCRRLLRNDHFYAPPSLRRRNVLFPHCLKCAQGKNSERYAETSSSLRDRRVQIWCYIAPSCAACGFSTHSSALDMHHLRQEEKESALSSLIAECAATPTARHAERLLQEAKKCVPLCANCHRMLHAGVLELSAHQLASRPTYTLADFLSILARE